jgi:hypothetical protein
MLLVEARRKTKVRELDMPVFVDEDVVGFYVADSAVVSETEFRSGNSIVKSKVRLTDG